MIMTRHEIKIIVGIVPFGFLSTLFIDRRGCCCNRCENLVPISGLGIVVNPTLMLQNYVRGGSGH